MYAIEMAFRAFANYKIIRYIGVYFIWPTIKYFGKIVKT